MNKIVGLLGLFGLAFGVASSKNITPNYMSRDIKKRVNGEYISDGEIYSYIISNDYFSLGSLPRNLDFGDTSFNNMLNVYFIDNYYIDNYLSTYFVNNNITNIIELTDIYEMYNIDYYNYSLDTYITYPTLEHYVLYNDSLSNIPDYISFNLGSIYGYNVDDYDRVLYYKGVLSGIDYYLFYSLLDIDNIVLYDFTNYKNFTNYSYLNGDGDFESYVELVSTSLMTEINETEPVSYEYYRFSCSFMENYENIQKYNNLKIDKSYNGGLNVGYENGLNANTQQAYENGYKKGQSDYENNISDILDKEFNDGKDVGFEEGKKYILDLQDSEYNFKNVFNKLLSLELFPGFKLYYILIFSFGLVIFRGVARALF